MDEKKGAEDAGNRSPGHGEVTVTQVGEGDSGDGSGEIGEEFDEGNVLELHLLVHVSHGYGAKRNQHKIEGQDLHDGTDAGLMIEIGGIGASQQDDKGEGPGREQGECESRTYLVRGQVSFLNDVTGNAKIAHGTGKSDQYSGDGIQANFGGVE